MAGRGQQDAVGAEEPQQGWGWGGTGAVGRVLLALW